MTDARRIAGVVLAAGASSRMGRPKPLLPIAGSTYVRHLVDKMGAAGVDLVAVVVGSDAALVRTADLGDAVVIDNPDWRTGMLGSVQAAARWLQAEGGFGAMLMIPVDQPRVALATMTSVLAAWRRDGAPVTVPVYRGRRGHPVLFDRVSWPRLLRAPADGGARVVVRGYADAVLTVPVDDPWVLVDADTPSQHDRMAAGRCSIDGDGARSGP